MKINLTLDSFAVILYCSDLIPSPYPELTIEEWNEVTNKLNLSSMSEVSRLFGMGEEVLTQIIGIEEFVAQKIINRNTLMTAMFHSLHNLENEGINITTQYEDNYPKQLLKLKQRAPLILYYVGDLSLIGNDNVSIVGPQKTNSRYLNLTKHAVHKVSDENRTLVAAGIKGVDAYGVKLMLENQGKVIFFVSDHLFDKKRTYEKEIREGKVLILSAVDPYAYFNVTNALDRNIYICGLSSHQFVIASRINSGATWFTSIQNFHFNWTEQLVINVRGKHNGNIRLIEMGAIPVSENDLQSLMSIDEIVEKNKIIETVDEPVIDQMSIYEFIED
ncbi:MAG: DNA-processing protein DprA [Erysipelotrichaceae bacterium]|nr:DNA-processing protein DprA [Erysipelotrichaceae bacterium]